MVLSVPALRPARRGVRATAVDRERWSVGIGALQFRIEAASSQSTSSNTELRPGRRNEQEGRVTTDSSLLELLIVQI